MYLGQKVPWIYIIKPRRVHISTDFPLTFSTNPNPSLPVQSHPPLPSPSHHPTHPAPSHLRHLHHTQHRSQPHRPRQHISFATHNPSLHISHTPDPSRSTTPHPSTPSHQVKPPRRWSSHCQLTPPSGWTSSGARSQGEAVGSASEGAQGLFPGAKWSVDSGFW